MRSAILAALLVMCGCDNSAPPPPPGPACEKCRSTDVEVKGTVTTCRACNNVRFEKKNGDQPACTFCQGTGFARPLPGVQSFVACGSCKGSGVAAKDGFRPIPPPPPVPPPCKACAGKGKTEKGACGTCGGTGKMPGH